MIGQITTPRRERFEGRVALVTGTTSGIGKATVLLFAREGATVVITGRRVQLGKAIVTQIETDGGRGAFIAADHTRASDCRRVIETVIAGYGRLDILFNNAGVVTIGNAESTSDEDWFHTLDLNVTAVLFLASDDSSFMTGTTLVVDGGNTAR